MRVYGLDFTSAPKKQKPITCAVCLLTDDELAVETVEEFTGFDRFDEFLASDGPWIAGLDFPFGQPRKLIENLDWPLIWKGYVNLVGSLDKPGYGNLFREQPDGGKRLLRKIDKKANSRSPMQLDFIPVGKMFFEGAPRLLKSGASIIPNHPSDSDRVIVEAYPALVARKFIRKVTYKNDTRSKQTENQKQAREKIIEGICSDRLNEFYDFSLQLSNEQIDFCINEPGADVLDSILCAIQAAWSYSQKDNDYGIPSDCDLLEGWIVDPAML